MLIVNVPRIPQIAALAIVAGAALVLALLPAAVLGSRSSAPTSLQVTLAALPFTVPEPVYVGNAADGSGRLFVVQRAGIISIFKHNTLLATPFLSITDRVGSLSIEQGLLSVAFPPDFSARQRFYVYYTDKSGNITISRFNISADPDRANGASETKILTVMHPINANHNGGQLQFGPDGYLYAGTGDGGSSGDPPDNAQNTTVLLGKLLRLDPESSYPAVPTYTVPASNPFTQAVNTRPEIWALGLRNPWRFSFDRATGDLYIGDVGQDLWEEVDFQTAGSPGGQNYGWSCYEGFAIYSATRCSGAVTYTMPITAYPHNPECSVTGGYVYRGGQYTQLAGRYIFGDFCSGRIWAIQKVGNQWNSQELFHATFLISSFGEDESGALYVAAFGDGRIYRLGNIEPVQYLPLIRR